MVEDGLWLSRKRRRSFHQPRLRREAYGELIQRSGVAYSLAKRCTDLLYGFGNF
jgi:hypothetical protein